MKTTMIFSLCLLLTTMGMSQSQAVMDFHNKFKDNGKYLSLKIEGGLLKMLSNIETNDKDTREMLDAMNKIDAINVHCVERKDSGFDESEIKDFKRDIYKENFDELMIVRDGDSDIDFLIKEKKGKISDLLFLVDEPDEFVIVSISGDIDLKTIGRITKNMDIKGSEHLDKLEEQ